MTQEAVLPSLETLQCWLCPLQLLCFHCCYHLFCCPPCSSRCFLCCLFLLLFLLLEFPKAPCRILLDSVELFKGWHDRHGLFGGFLRVGSIWENGHLEIKQCNTSQRRTFYFTHDRTIRASRFGPKGEILSCTISSIPILLIFSASFH